MTSRAPRDEGEQGWARDTLAGLPLFDHLAEDQVDAVASATRIRRLARGQQLFDAGQECTAFFCVVRGQITLTLAAADGTEKVLEIVSAGETFGEAVVFAGRAYPVRAVGLVPALLLEVPAGVVLDLVAGDPMFARRMLAGMATRLHGLIGDVASLTLRNATQRVAAYLHGLVPRGAGPDAEVTLPVGKAVLASRLGLTPETLSRTLRELSAGGVLTVDGRRIRLTDIGGLAEAAGLSGPWARTGPGHPPSG